MKKCYFCQIEKPLNEFYKDKTRKDGHGTRCIVCTKAYVGRIRPGDKDTKHCPKCGIIHPITAFDKSNSGDGYQTACRDCRKSIKLEWEERNKDKRFFERIARLYGVTKEHYEEMWAKQSGSCGICMKSHLVLVVDHDHDTGQVRGLLCQACNKGLGFFRDNLQLLDFAKLYLVNHGGKEWR